MRLVSGGNDARVIIWKCENESWSQDTLLWHSDCHTDWVRDVAWRPTGSGMIASGSWDKSVCIWSQEMETQPWRLLCKIPIPGKVENLAWSVTGSTLAVTTDNNETFLYREATNGGFEQVATVSEVGIVDTNPAPISPKAIATGFAAPDAPPAAAAPAAPPPMAEFQQQQQNVMDSFGL
jgi:WD40 repeat protein